MAAGNRNERYWQDESLPLAEGCVACADRGLCGGLRVPDKVESCLSYCDCGEQRGDLRGTVCKCDPSMFVQRKREVHGWELDLPHVTPTACPRLPGFIPMIYGHSNRSRAFKSEAVAIPLNQVFSHRTGKLLVETRADLCQRFLVDAGAKLVISAVHYDQTLEDYWAFGRRQGIATQLRGLGVDLVTTPNFSVFPGVPRWDNFHNMKRIAICWRELAETGLPTALHVNARTTVDYDRWSDFLRQHPEIDTITFEFQTGAASPRRGEWHVMRLQSLAVRAPQPLAIIVFGGQNYIARLKGSFASVVHVSSAPYLKAVHYRMPVASNGDARLRWRRADPPVAVDELLRVNVREYAASIAKVERGSP